MTNMKFFQKRAIPSLLLSLFACLTSWAQYVAIYADPYSGGMVQVGTERPLDAFSDGASFTIANSGETVYFSYEPFSDYQFKGIRYTNLSSDAVVEVADGIYSFTMPDFTGDNFWVSIFVELEKIPVVVTGIDINEENFPDPQFRSWLLKQSYGTDAVITDDEMATITQIEASASGITDLTGIEYFTELTALKVQNYADTPEEDCNRISSLNLSALPKLRTLWCSYNQIGTLDVSACPELRDLHCNDNALTQLLVADNNNLSLLYCDNNQLVTLDVTANPNLAVLSCHGNQLTALDVTNNLLLEQLYCENNQIISIDVTNHDKLMLLNCNDNQLTALDLTGCTELFQFYCYNNRIGGQAMTDMVNSLETPPRGGYMVVVDLGSGIEQNDITQEQADVAKAKNWSVEAIEGEDFIPYPKSDDHDYVDLGLPSGTLWATCNVGATTPQGIGLFFAWGDTVGHGSDISDGYLFSWENYKWAEVSGEDTYFTKYCSDGSRAKDGLTDGKVELDPEDDAAYVNWGSQWRTPSKEQLDELKDLCTWTATTLHGVEGYEVTGPNGNTIFLPETGWRIDDMLLEGGAYWSCTTNPEDDGGAYYLGWDDYGEYTYGGRLDGQCVRPVVNMIKATISTSTYATLYYEHVSLAIPEGVEAYTVARGDGTITLTPLDGVVPAGCPVVIHGAEGAYSFMATYAEPFEGVNDLIGSEEGGRYSEEGYKYYVLCYKNADKDPEEVGFFFLTGSKGKYAEVKAHQAYMRAPLENANADGYALSWGESGPTGITSIDQPVAAGQVYTLSGVRVDGRRLQKGVYIVDGRKMVVK